MPTFKFESAIPTGESTFLLPIPNVQWFADSVLQALAEMTIRENWYGDDEAQRTTAIEDASEMLARYKLTSFNPFPVGMIFPFGGTVAPAGYLACDGSSQLTTDFPELFAQIGYYFGGSGGNFNVPDLINRVAIGSSGDFAIGDIGGEQTHTLNTSEMPSHTHTDIGHNHTIPTTLSLPAQAGVGFAGLTAVPLVPSFTGTSSANLLNTGGDGAHNNMQPYLAALYIIYAGR